jgi:hypothetical protein
MTVPSSRMGWAFSIGFLSLIVLPDDEGRLAPFCDSVRRYNRGEPHATNTAGFGDLPPPRPPKIAELAVA